MAAVSARVLGSDCVRKQPCGKTVSGCDVAGSQRLLACGEPDYLHASLHAGCCTCAACVSQCILDTCPPLNANSHSLVLSKHMSGTLTFAAHSRPSGVPAACMKRRGGWRRKAGQTRCGNQRWSRVSIPQTRQGGCCTSKCSLDAPHNQCTTLCWAQPHPQHAPRHTQIQSLECGARCCKRQARCHEYGQGEGRVSWIHTGHMTNDSIKMTNDSPLNDWSASDCVVLNCELISVV